MKTRRTIISVFLVLLGAATACGDVVAEPSRPAPRLGLQLWSVKDELRRDFDGTLARIAQLGFQGVEFAGQFGPYRSNPAGLKAILDKNGLQCAGAHVIIGQLAPRYFVTTTAFYKTLGCHLLVVPMDARGGDAGQAAALGKDLTDLSAKLKAENMRIGYHNHAQEFSGTVGDTAWDVIARSTPNDVVLQQDVGWTTFAGKDPVFYVRRYPGRTVSTHFKAKVPDGAPGKPIIGQDGTDWLALIRAVREVGGTEWIIIEQEEYPDGLTQLGAVAASSAGLKSFMADADAR